MRRLAPVALSALALAGCERLEGPGFVRPATFAVIAETLVAPDGRRVFFPRNRQEPGAREAVGIVALLTLQGECLLFGDVLLVWPPDARLNLSQPGRITIEHRGISVVVGQTMITSGLGRPGRLDAAAPNPCPGRAVHAVASFQPYDAEPGRITRPPAPGPVPSRAPGQ